MPGSQAGSVLRAWITIVKTLRLHGYSASHGMQEPALREAIADIQRGDYRALIVTESSRLDRREGLDAQAEILLSIRGAGGDVVSIAEPQFGKTDLAGRMNSLARVDVPAGEGGRPPLAGWPREPTIARLSAWKRCADSLTS
jgi:hypothetical protein